MAITYPPPQPYRLDWTPQGDISGVNGQIADIVSMADTMFEMLFNRPTIAIDDTGTSSSSSSSSSSGVTSVVNDTNVTGSIAGTALTLGWSGTLSQARGGFGKSSAGVTDGQVPIGKTSDGSWTFAALTAGSGITITNGGGTITVAATATGSIFPTTANQGDIFYASAANTIAALAKDTTAAQSRYLGNTGASNNPAWGQVNLANGVTGNISSANINSGSGASSTTFLRGDMTWATLASTIGSSDLDTLMAVNRWGTVTTRAASTVFEQANCTSNSMGGSFTSGHSSAGTLVNMNTGGTANQGAGIAGSLTSGWIRGDQTSTFYGIIKTSGAITNCRFWIGWTDNLVFAVNSLSSDTLSPVANMVIVRCSVGTDANWVAVTANSTTQTVNGSSLGAIAINTVYTIKITLAAGTATFQINGGSIVSTSTTVPTTAMFPVCCVTDKIGAVQTLGFHRMYFRGGSMGTAF